MEGLHPCNKNFFYLNLENLLVWALKKPNEIILKYLDSNLDRILQNIGK